MSEYYIKIQLLLLCLFISHISYEQNIISTDIIKSIEIDSIYSNQTDSIYIKIKKEAYKNKITKALYRLVFIKPSYLSLRESSKIKQSNELYTLYEGMYIRKIDVRVIKPFEKHKDKNSQKESYSKLDIIGNSLHKTTRSRNILNKINIKVGDKIRGENIAEYERIIRNLPYIKDAYFHIEKSKIHTNMVDIVLIVKDRFAWGIRIKSSSLNSNRIGLQNKNLYGLGHQASAVVNYSPEETKKQGISLKYNIIDIHQTHIDTKLRYENTHKKSDFEIIIDKGFYNSNIKYSWGVEIHKSFKNKKIDKYEPLYNEIDLRYNKNRFWLARSFKLKSENKYTIKHIVTSGLFKNILFINRPKVGTQENRSYHNRDIFLTSISYSKYNYLKSNLIYNFNKIEDIPYGELFKMTLGYEHGEYHNRYYFSLLLSHVKNLNTYKHYLYKQISFASFICNNKLEQGLLNIELKYISKLQTISQYRLRSFLGLALNMGIRRFEEEYISLAEGYGIKGTRKDMFNGKTKLILNLENVLFTPYTIGGFRFAIFNFIDSGFIADKHESILKQKLYYGAGIGIRIHNANLVFSTFSISLAIYPNAPKDFGMYHYRIYNTDKAKFNNFESSKPKLLEYK